MPRFEQLDLFGEWPGHRAASHATPAQAIAPEALSDEALVSIIPDVSLACADAIAAEAGRRRLATAVPALEKLCNRFAGYGAGASVPEQVAALGALGAIGGVEAAQAVLRVIARRVVQSQTLATALSVAAELGVFLPSEQSSSLLRDPNPSVRAAACGCARLGGEVIAILLELMGDPDDEVAVASACAVGRMGRSEARAPLKRLLRERPSRRVVEALARVADEEAIVILARVARTRRELTEVVIAALEEIESPRASEVLGALAKSLRPSP